MRSDLVSADSSQPTQDTSNRLPCQDSTQAANLKTECRVTTGALEFLRMNHSMEHEIFIIILQSFFALLLKPRETNERTNDRPASSIVVSRRVHRRLVKPIGAKIFSSLIFLLFVFIIIRLKCSYRAVKSLSACGRRLRRLGPCCCPLCC